MFGVRAKIAVSRCSATTGVRAKAGLPRLNEFGVSVKIAPSPLLVQLLAAVFTLTPIMVLLTACGGPEPPASEAGTTTTEVTTQDGATPNTSATTLTERTAPPSVSYHEHPAAGQREPAAETLTNPLSADPNAAAQGKMLFAAMNCDGCHGGGAVGFVGPSLVDGRWRYGGDDGELFHSISYGRREGMPAYGGILPDITVWHLITYIPSEPVPAVVPTMAQM